jgi:hypothetical protein
MTKRTIETFGTLDSKINYMITHVYSHQTECLRDLLRRGMVDAEKNLGIMIPEEELEA